MNILLTNDDGIGSPGLMDLAGILRSRREHHIFVLAPDRNRSGVSHGLTMLTDPLRLTEIEKDTWSCSGKPADCVLAAVLGEKPCKPDVVVAGINKGANLGSDIIYSGTDAAARQAALMGIPGIALSLAAWEGCRWEMAAAYAADHLEEFLALWKEDTFINVNIPNTPEGPGGMVHTWPAIKRYHDKVSYIKVPDGREWCFLVSGNSTSDAGAGSDVDAVSRNLVSVSAVCAHPVIRRDSCAGAPDYVAAGAREGC
jgi:5'-nucleotidase